MNLAIAQYRIGATRDAAANFRRVLAAFPQYVPAMTNLARILATDHDDRLRDGPQALALAQKALQLTPPQDPERVDRMDILAMAYAEVGQFDQAVETARAAAALAQQAGHTALAEEILPRVAIYQQHRPLRITVLPPSLATAPAAQNASAPAPSSR